MSYYDCPVCGYDKMTAPPAQWYICSCCGTEFEADDDLLSHEQLRVRWLAEGAHWFSNVEPAPYGWNAYRQLQHAGFLEFEIQNQFFTNFSEAATLLNNLILVQNPHDHQAHPQVDEAIDWIKNVKWQISARFTDREAAYVN